MAVDTTPEAALRRPVRDVARVVAPVTLSVPPTTVLPAASIVVEAVAPKRARLPVSALAKSAVEVPAVAVKLVRATSVGSESVTAPVAADAVIWLVVPAMEVTPVLVMVTAPVAPETLIPVPATLDVTPVLVTLPALYARPDENVVVAVHVGMPFKKLRT